MFARVTKFKMKPASVAPAMDLMETIKGQILALPGLHQFINVVDADGNGYVISLVESREISDANADAVKAIWGQFADHLEAMPVPEGFDVMANWSPG